MARRVYIIEIDQKWVPIVAPKAEPGRRCFYVGETGLTTRRRFSRHRYGIKAARCFRTILKEKGSPLERNVDVYLRRTMSDKYGAVETTADAVALEAKVIDDLRGQGYIVFPEHAGSSIPVSAPVADAAHSGLRLGSFEVEEVAEEQDIAGRPPMADAELVGSATTYLVESATSKTRLLLGDIRWPNGERTVQMLDRLESPARFDRLAHGLRLTVLGPGDTRYVELKQARMKGEQWSNLYKATAEELNGGAGVDVGLALADVGAIAVGTREAILGDTGKSRSFLCAEFDDDGDLVPLCAYVLTRVGPIERSWRSEA